MTQWHDLNRAPMRPSRLLQGWIGPERARAAAAHQSRLGQQSRAYEGAAVNRLTGDWMAQATSADSELLTSLRLMRNRSRELVRDNPFAKQAVRVIANNVVGQGIGMQAQVKNARGGLVTKINDSIEEQWEKWCNKTTCHTAGLLGFADIERLATVQLVTAGECIIRKIRQPMGGGTIPLALEIIEADRLLDNWQTARAPNGNIIRMGVEIDKWHRPVAYWFSPQHPGDYQFATFEPSRFMRVPAEDIIHLYIIERWPQTRGEPWFHATLRSLRDEGGLSESEIVKARASANIVGFIKSPEPLAATAVDGDGRRLIDTEPGTWQQLLPGEDIAGMTGYAPNPSLDPFLRYMVRKMAIGVGISYESLSRDYSQSNYSSSRMALLDDRDLYRVIQGFFCRNFRQDIHSEFLDAGTLVGALKVGADYYTAPDKYRCVRFKPRGWSWIDPAKEVAAYKMAVRNGFMTQTDVVAQTANGADLEDILKTRRAELDLAAELGLVFDSDPEQVNDKGAAQVTPIDPDAQAEAGVGSEQGEGGATGQDEQPTDESNPQDKGNES